MIFGFISDGISNVDSCKKKKKKLIQLSSFTNLLLYDDQQKVFCRRPMVYQLWQRLVEECHKPVLGVFEFYYAMHVAMLCSTGLQKSSRILNQIYFSFISESFVLICWY